MQIKLTSQIGEKHRLCEHSLANPEDDQKKLLCEEELCRSPDLKPRVFQNLQFDLPPIFPLHLLWFVQKPSHERSTGLKRNENKENRVGDLACLISIDIQPQIDCSSKDLACKTVGEPVSESFAFIPRFGVGNCDGSFGHPEYASGDATKRSTKEGQPFSAKAVVSI